MQVKLRRIGNSVGVTIPQHVLKTFDVDAGDTIEIEITHVVRHPREGWGSENAWPGAEDEGLILVESQNQFDEEDWEW